MTALLRSTSLVGEMLAEVAQCLAAYDQIPPGADVAVALSGGVDSWTMLALLAELVRLNRLDARLSAIHIELGHPGAAERLAMLSQGCRAAGVPLLVRHTSIGPAAVDEGGKRPCFLCARRRRQALFEMARDHDLTHIATGHHRDDVLATFVLNLLENRELSTLVPRQESFGGRFFLIRPLFAMPKERIDKLHRQQGFPVIASGCPLDGTTRRADAERLLASLEAQMPGARDAVFAALHRVKPDFLPRKVDC